MGICVLAVSRVVGVTVSSDLGRDVHGSMFMRRIALREDRLCASYPTDNHAVDPRFAPVVFETGSMSLRPRAESLDDSSFLR